MDLVDNTRCRSDKIQIIFSFQALLDDIQMKQSQKATPETKSKCDRCLRFILQSRVIDLKFLECIPKIRVFCAVCWIKSAVNHRIYFFIARKCLRTRPVCFCHRITHACLTHILDPRTDITYHSRAQFLTRDKLTGSEIAHFRHFIHRACRHQLYLCANLYAALHDPAKYNHALIGIINCIKDQCLERCLRISLWCRDPRYDLL